MSQGPGWWRRRTAPLRGAAERVEDVASVSLVTVTRAASAEEALHVAATCRVRHLLVAEAAELLGVLCTCDLLTCPPTVRVGRRMSTPPVTIASSAPLDLAMTLMRSHSVACLPVLRQGSLTGILTRRDLRSAGVDFVEPRCGTCGHDHHVRTEPETGAFICVRCLAAR
jgi:CBS domain-containing protein